MMEDFGADPALVASQSSQSPLSRPSGFDPGELLSEEVMLGSFFKEYAELGHWFDKAHGKCVNCGAATIDLYEDGAYGPVRSCASGMEAFGRDGETRLDAKHDSPTAESGDAQTQSQHPKGNN